MKRFIVITSIFPPSEGVRLFSEQVSHQVIVVGDKKTDRNWSHPDVVYLPLTRQRQIGPTLSKSLPVNHYCRKMVGYLYAAQQGADVIIDTDDDNLPKKNWGFPDLDGLFSAIPPEKGFINIYQYYTREKIWPRGLPVHLINADTGTELEKEKKQCKVGIWQSLVDDEPDVDAIYRLTLNEPRRFSEREPLVLGEKTISPFNSQNTLIRKDLFALLYLPGYVSFRFTDILRGLVAQPLMWLYGYHLGFYNATAIQKRNAHDYFEDFLLEIPMYRYVPEITEIVCARIAHGKSIADNLFLAYEGLYKKKIVLSRELRLLEAWLKDLPGQ